MFSAPLTHYFVNWHNVKLSHGSSDTCKFQAWRWYLQLVVQNCHLPKINWCFLTEFPMQWNKFYDWCLGYIARIEWVSFISRFRLVRLSYYQIDFMWCNKTKPDDDQNTESTDGVGSPLMKLHLQVRLKNRFPITLAASATLYQCQVSIVVRKKHRANNF